MTDLDQMIEQLRRMRARPEAAERDWYRVNAKPSNTAEIHIFDDIGWMGTSAKALSNEIKALDVEAIELHLNSPGGDAWDGIAIYNTLRDHKADVTVIVDGVAASAASIVAMAGDTVRMNRGSQLMVHDAWGLVIGNASDQREAAGMFDRISDAMATIYAGRAGGTVEEWRKAMGSETWYTAQEAVDAGLADELVAADEKPAAQARWDLAAYAFAHAGRDAAPAPEFPRKPEPPAPISAATAARRIHAASTRTKEGAGRMDPAKIREALGLAADASDGEVKAALVTAGLANQPDPVPDPDPAPAPNAAPGVMQVSASVWEEQQRTIANLTEFVQEARRGERDSVLAKAVEQGKFTPAQKTHFAKLWDADPQGTRDLIDNLTPNTALAVQASGYDGDIDGKAFDREFAGLFPNGFFGKVG